MFPFPNPFDLFGAAAGEVVGWAWDKVIQGVYTWFANGLLLLMEWVWGVLDTATTPRLTESWFASGLMQPLAAISLGIIVAMMLLSAVQAGFGGRPELIVDAFKEGPKAIVATSLTLVVMDVLIRGADVLSDTVWQTGRGDAQKVLDGLAATMSNAGGLATTFLGPVALLFGMIGLLVTAVVLFMRSALLYLVAAFAPIVWASSVSPVMRGSARRLVHLTVALVLAKPAISVTLVVGVKLLANADAGPAGSDGVAALGTLVSGFACFAIAGLSPWVVFKLLPSVESAAVSSGIVGGWGRSAMTGVQAGLMVKSFGASAAASTATRPLPQMAAGASPASSDAATSTGGFSGLSSPPGNAGSSRVATGPSAAARRYEPPSQPETSSAGEGSPADRAPANRRTEGDGGS
jgi:hypothetical protein